MGVVVVTGCSTGIGLETALAFGRAGETVYVTMRDTSRAEALVAGGERDGSRIEVVALDVTDDISVDGAARQIPSSSPAAIVRTSRRTCPRWT